MGKKEKKPPKTRNFRGHKYFLMPTSERNTRKAIEKVAWSRKRFAKRVHIKKVGNKFYVYSSNE